MKPPQRMRLPALVVESGAVLADGIVFPRCYGSGKGAYWGGRRDAAFLIIAAACGHTPVTGQAFPCRLFLRRPACWTRPGRINRRAPPSSSDAT